MPVDSAVVKNEEGRVMVEERKNWREKLVCSRYDRGKRANKERYFLLAINTYELNVCQFRLPRNLALILITLCLLCDSVVDAFLSTFLSFHLFSLL